MTYPSISPVLAAEVGRAIGRAAGDDVETLVDRFRAWMPMGTSAKLRALEEGRPPPGHEPAHALEARLDGSLDGWSCWSACTSLGALLADGGHDVSVMAEHRRGRRSVDVDFHSVLIVDGALVDPFLGPSAPVAPGVDVVRPDGWATWVPGVRPDHLGGRRASVFHYRQLADHLERADVRAFCDVSATHSGAPRYRTAHWLRGATLWSLKEDDDGVGRLWVTVGDGPWDAVRRLERTGRYDELLADAFAGADPA